MTIHPGGRKCFCGKDGCVEAYTSSRRLSTELGITLEEFFYEAKIGNERYNVLLHEYLDDLTTGINNLYTMSDGDIILGGPVAKYLPPYQNEITRLLIEKYSFDTDASYFSFAKCTPEQSDTGAALTFLGDFISSI
jgi:predicted NBD/HSP70 family sugar kinase